MTHLPRPTPDRRKKKCPSVSHNLFDLLLDLDRGQIAVVCLTVALYFLSPISICVVVQPVSTIFFYRFRNNFADTGVLHALVVTVLLRSSTVFVKILIENLTLLVVNIVVFSAWLNRRRIFEDVSVRV
jgi:hypothetical protein